MQISRRKNNKKIKVVLQFCDKSVPEISGISGTLLKIMPKKHC